MGSRVLVGIGWAVLGVGWLVACGPSSRSDGRANSAGNGGGSGSGGVAGRPSGGAGSGGSGGGPVAGKGGSAGASGRAGASSGDAGTSSTVAGRSGAGGGAGAGGAAGAGAASAGANNGGGGGTGGEPVAGTSAGGDGGSGAMAGTGGVFAGEWAAACNGVTNIGRCVNGVYEWCDYSARGIERIDCGALGMTCRAEPHELGSDFTNSGCFGDACRADENRCDGTLLYKCGYDGMMTLHDCVRSFGADATCDSGQFGTPSCLAPPCEPRDTATCDGNIGLRCGIDGEFNIVNCAEQDPAGTCIVVDAEEVLCGGQNIHPI